jgi:hypothetical protein
MIMKQPTQEELDHWKAIWLQQKGQLKPNRKSGTELLDYLKTRYPLTEIVDSSFSRAAEDCILQNAFQAEKLPSGQSPMVKCYRLENTKSGKRFYDQKDPFFSDVSSILICIDLVSGCYTVEGSSLLWDELCAYQGLDEFDLENFVCVAQYLMCTNKMKSQLQENDTK